MSLKQLNNFFYTIRFRLLLWYIILFFISCLLLFGVIYQKVKQQSINNVDEAMLDTLRELREMLSSSGEKGLTDHMRIESEISQQRKKSFRLLTVNGSQRQFFARPLWKKLAVNKTLLQQARQTGRSQFETMQIPGHHSMGRIMYGVINDKLMVQMGFSMAEEWRMLRKIRHTFLELLLIVVLPLAIIVGWLMSKNALREVNQLDTVAKRVADGKLEQRMAIPKHPTEISRLAITFNTMLDRIEMLLAEEREITDNMAHDLRSPLTRIKGEIEVNLNAQRSEDDYRQLFCSILEEINTLQVMIDNILDIASVEYAVLTDRQSVNLKKFLEEVIDIFVLAAEDKQLELTLKCPDNITAILAPHYMRRAIANLIDNAIKYSTANHAIIVSGSQTADSLIIKVKDNGIGIANEEIGKIFQRLYRSESCRSTPGHGLGLALVAAIVKSHGGTITVTSTLGAGSTFVITLSNDGEACL